MQPVTRETIIRMVHRLPDKQRAANSIRQTVPHSGQAKPDRPLALATSGNRPAFGASSNEGGGALFLIRCYKRRTGDAVGGGLCP